MGFQVDLLLVNLEDCSIFDPFHPFRTKDEEFRSHQLRIPGGHGKGLARGVPAHLQVPAEQLRRCHWDLPEEDAEMKCLGFLYSLFWWRFWCGAVGEGVAGLEAAPSNN